MGWYTALYIEPVNGDTLYSVDVSRANVCKLSAIHVIQLIILNLWACASYITSYIHYNIIEFSSVQILVCYILEEDRPSLHETLRCYDVVTEGVATSRGW